MNKEAFRFDAPAHTSRIRALNITSGACISSVPPSFSVLRKSSGFHDRKKAWTELLLATSNLAEDRARYWQQVQNAFQPCQGCERLECSHVYHFGANFLAAAAADAAMEEDINKAWEENLFALHRVQEEEQKNSIKRLLLVLERDFDFEYAPSLIDLVVILSLYLSEVETYAVIRKIVTSSSLTFTKLPRKRQSFTPRKFLPTTFASSASVHVTFIECVKRMDKPLYQVLQAFKSQVSLWFDRWLIPILPFSHIIVLIDCLIAGDDLKLLFHAAMSTLQTCRRSILDKSKSNSATNLSQEIFGKTAKLNYSSRIPRRRNLIKMESSWDAKDYGKAPLKEPLAHVAKTAFENSYTILTYEAASRLVRMIPRQLRHSCSRLRRVYQSEIGPVGESKLFELYQACENEKNCSFIVVVSAVIPAGPDDLNEKKFSLTEKTNSTSFSHPLVKDANYAVFGVFTSLQLQVSKPNRESAVNGGSAENTFLFRNAPGYSAKVWKAKAGEPSIIDCQAAAFLVGKSSASGYALLLDSTLKHGETTYSELFDNEPLCTVTNKSADQSGKVNRDHYYFNIFAVEVFVLPNF